MKVSRFARSHCNPIADFGNRVELVQRVLGGQDGRWIRQGNLKAPHSTTELQWS